MPESLPDSQNQSVPNEIKAIYQLLLEHATHPHARETTKLLDVIRKSEWLLCVTLDINDELWPTQINEIIREISVLLNDDLLDSDLDAFFLFQLESLVQLAISCAIQYQKSPIIATELEVKKLHHQLMQLDQVIAALFLGKLAQGPVVTDNTIYDGPSGYPNKGISYRSFLKRKIANAQAN